MEYYGNSYIVIDVIHPSHNLASRRIRYSIWCMISLGGQVIGWLGKSDGFRGSVDPWFHGSVDPWFRACGSLVPWIPGSMDPWIRRSLVPCIRGAVVPRPLMYNSIGFGLGIVARCWPGMHARLIDPTLPRLEHCSRLASWCTIPSQICCFLDPRASRTSQKVVVLSLASNRCLWCTTSLVLGSESWPMCC